MFKLVLVPPALKSSASLLPLGGQTWGFVGAGWRVSSPVQTAWVPLTLRMGCWGKGSSPPLESVGMPAGTVWSAC